MLSKPFSLNCLHIQCWAADNFMSSSLSCHTSPTIMFTVDGVVLHFLAGFHTWPDDRWLQLAWKLPGEQGSLSQCGGPSGADRTQVGPMLAPWTLLSGYGCHWRNLMHELLMYSPSNSICKVYKTCSWYSLPKLWYLYFIHLKWIHWFTFWIHWNFRCWYRNISESDYDNIYADNFVPCFACRIHVSLSSKRKNFYELNKFFIRKWTKLE